MTNSWITHVKNYAKANNISYKEALSEAKTSYLSGGSLKSDIVARILKNNPNKFDISRIQKPSRNLIARYKREEPQPLKEIIKEEPKRKIVINKQKVMKFLSQIEMDYLSGGLLQYLASEKKTKISNINKLNRKKLIEYIFLEKSNIDIVKLIKYIKDDFIMSNFPVGNDKAKYLALYEDISSYNDNFELLE